jgi:hypothetical protein
MLLELKQAVKVSMSGDAHGKNNKRCLNLNEYYAFIKLLNWHWTGLILENTCLICDLTGANLHIQRRQVLRWYLLLMSQSKFDKLKRHLLPGDYVRHTWMIVSKSYSRNSTICKLNIALSFFYVCIVSMNILWN